MMRHLLVYVDQGVGPRSVKQLIQALKSTSFPQDLSVHTIDSRSLLNTDWEKKAAALIFPGGRDLLYLQALKGAGNTRIRQFVEKGGSYLGFCAGAYYASDSIEFEKGSSLEVLGKRELCFFPGVAKGPIYGSGCFRYEDEQGARLASLSGEGGKIACYYNGGCAFLDADHYPHIQILYRYADLLGEPPAIIECKVGKGKAILSGVHPEYSASYIGSTLDPFLSDLLPKLQLHEEERKLLFTQLVQRLTVRL